MPTSPSPASPSRRATPNHRAGRKKLTPGQRLAVKKVAKTDPSKSGPGWRVLSAEYTRLSEDRCGRIGVMVMVAPGATEGVDARGYYMDSINRIMLDGDLLPDSPQNLSPLVNDDHFKAMAVLHGVFVHECGHAAHTAGWHFDTDERLLAEIVSLLEEIRMEARVVERRPDDARWLKACVETIILEGADTNIESAGESLGAAGTATLILGRVAAGSLDIKDVPNVETAFKQVFDPQMQAALWSIWRDACAVGDERRDDLGPIAQRLIDLFPELQRPCGGTCIICGQGGGSGQQQGAGSGQDQENDDAGSQGDSDDTQDEDQPEGDHVCASCAGQIIKDAAEQDVKNASGQAQDDLSEDEEARGSFQNQAGKAAADEAIQTAARAEGGRQAGTPSGEQPGRGERLPTDEETSARNGLAKKLREVRWRQPHQVRRQRQLPPGRLRGREALRRSAERTQGRMVTANPWSHKKRQYQELPYVTCGILVDTSGSMCGGMDALSGATWALSNAICDNGGSAACVAFGNSVETIFGPHQPPRFVIDFQAGGGTAGVPETLEFMEKELNWEKAHGPRLLIVISDGYWFDGDEGDNALLDLIDRGVKVVHVGVGADPAEHAGHKTCVIEDALDLVPEVGQVAVEALKNY